MSKTFLRRYFIAAVVGAAVLVALVVRARMAYQLFDIPSESMAPTLRIGDHFIVWREAYSSGGPQYGDIVVFRVPQLASVPFVKRIAGLPHDRIRMSGGVLYINGAPASQHRLPDFFDECGNGSRCPVPQYLETLPAGRVGRVLDRVSNGPGDDTETVVVPSDSYFVLGDNRDNSRDSRNGIGFVRRSELLGRVQWKYIEDGQLSWKRVN